MSDGRGSLRGNHVGEDDCRTEVLGRRDTSRGAKSGRGSGLGRGWDGRRKVLCVSYVFTIEGIPPSQIRYSEDIGPWVVCNP